MHVANEMTKHTPNKVYPLGGERGYEDGYFFSRVPTIFPTYNFKSKSLNFRILRIQF
jgi:hypothetical protein